MNQFLKLSLPLFFIGLLFAGCENDDDFSTIDLNTSIIHTVDVVIPDSTQKEYSQDFLINPINNEELSKYKEQLESFSIDKISFKIVNFQGSPEAEFEGTIQFEGSSYAIELPKTKLKETADNEVVTTLQVTDDLLSELTSIFSSLNQVKASTNGTVYNNC